MTGRLAVVLAIAALVTSAPLWAQGTPSPTVEAVDTSYVNYDSGPITLPLGIGLRIPEYNRVDGLALPWGPTIRLGGGRLVIDPTVTYRSNLGAFDFFGDATLQLGKNDELSAHVGRATFSNDRWNKSNLINSLAALVVGSDARNYFRADRGTLELRHTITSKAMTFVPRVGALHESAWSTGFHLPHTEAPWSILGRTDTLKMRRKNPLIWKGKTTSAIGGINIGYEINDVTAGFDAGVEHAFKTPATINGEVGQFTQFTLGGKTSFPTFGTQTFDFRGHAVFGFGDDPPPQRWAYLGGAGTLATVDRLALGGDKFVYVQGEYTYPLVRPTLPFVGAPVLSARYAAGSAGVGELPDFIQNIGVAIGVKLLKAEYHIDPNYKKTPYTSRSAFSIGFSLSL